VPVDDELVEHMTLAQPGKDKIDTNLPELPAFVADSGFPTEHVTTRTAAWDEVPQAYAATTTKLVLRREPLGSAPER
jgi:hypothetical protein